MATPSEKLAHSLELLRKLQAGSGAGAIRARDYFDAPGGREATAAVASCEEALAQFESDALSAELDESAPDSRPGLHALEGGND